MKNVVVGVTGGIACYKVADLVSKLKKHDINVDVIMTESACEFVNPLTFRTLSKNPVVTSTFAVPEAWKVGHISLAQKADVMLIAPATANVIGKVANGIADDMLTTTIMACKAKIVFAPAMNVNMYENPILQENIEKLKRLGYMFVEPGAGLLACGDVGKGRMAEPAEIEAFVLDLLYGEYQDGSADKVEKDLAGKRFLVTAGPTVEDIDPVRYISNRSSGKMGFAIAEAARARGAEVTLVCGPVKLTCSEDIRRIDVKTTKDMLAACESVFDDIDVVVKAAAPADFYVVNQSEHKMKKVPGQDNVTIELAKNPDVIATLGKKKGDRILVGFAAETRDLEKYAREKIVSKNLDMIVANDVSAPGAGFNHDTNIITVFKAVDSSKTVYDKMSKVQAADVILDNVVEIIKNR
ncbi:MAG: bifunctional phosphopantothenoylcysteine decarboxylase/phosphopantothenate--cysteine ligase CoaBC [Firmicutes bacterium]|nr:bifunctional phosphopantothenoylcysteine decarboxylase/phosphopantothenate--cysteine ligase CoaBC [Bacillota bacterium]